jgi:hypothetical protein
MPVWGEGVLIEKVESVFFSAYGTFDFGAGAPAGASLSCFAKKVSKEGDPTKHESPSSADNRGAAAGLTRFARSNILAETRPACSSLRRASRGSLKAQCPHRG